MAHLLAARERLRVLPPYHPKSLSMREIYGCSMPTLPQPNHVWPVFNIGDHRVMLTTYCCCPASWKHLASARFYKPGISPIEDLEDMLTRTVMFSCCIPQLSVHYAVIDTVHLHVTSESGQGEVVRMSTLEERVPGLHRCGWAIVRELQRRFAQLLIKQMGLQTHHSPPSVYLSTGTDRCHLKTVLDVRAAKEGELSENIDFSSPELSLSGAWSEDEEVNDFAFHYTPDWSDLASSACNHRHGFIGFLTCDKCDLRGDLVMSFLSVEMEAKHSGWLKNVFDKRVGMDKVTWPCDMYMSLDHDTVYHPTYD